MSTSSLKALLTSFYQSWYFISHYIVVISKTELQTKSKDWHNEELWEWSSRVLFYASANALWKDDFANEQLFQDLRAFDKDFALLVAGLPDSVTGYIAKKAIEIQQKFIKYLNAADYVRSVLITCFSSTYRIG